MDEKIIFLVLVLSSYTTSSYKILGLFPMQGKSHYVIVEPLLRALAERNHTVDVYSHFPLKKPIPNYNDISLQGSLPPVVNKLHSDNITWINSPSPRQVVSMLGNEVCELLDHPEFQKLIHHPPKDYDAVIYGLFLAHCFMPFGRHLNVPLIGLSTLPVHAWINDDLGNPSSLAFVESTYTGASASMTFYERLTNVLYDMFFTSQIKYYLDQQDVYVKKHFPGMPHISEIRKDFDLLLTNSHHSLHGVRPLTHSIVEVGGLHVKEDDSPLDPVVKKWLDESTNGCVFFTFGSMMRIETFDNATIKKFYDAFERLAPVRFIMKVAKKEDLMPGLPKNVMIGSWFQQVQILKHKNVKAFITHCGTMGTQEAIHWGVPLIGFPLFGDQPLNLKLYEKKKLAIGLNINDFTADELYRAIHTIINDPTYRDNVKKVSDLFRARIQNPLDTAIYWIEFTIRNRGALKSPAADLTWWQLHLLDVYASIALVLLLALWMIKRILYSILQVCSSLLTKKRSVPSSKKKKQ